MDISDFTKFTNMTEYEAYLCTIGFMFLSEFIIWVFANRNKNSKEAENRNKSDKGSVWLIILGI